MGNPTVSAAVQLTPAMLAEAFWELNSIQQAEFFQELNRVVNDDWKSKPGSKAWSLGEMQWLFVGDELETNKPARDMLMAMAAPLYLNTLRFAEGRAA